MILFKNPTPRDLSMLAAVVIGLLSYGTTWMAILLFNAEVPAVPHVLTALFMAVVSFILVNRTLDVFIYRKIKLIYKAIHRMKAPKGAVKKNVLAKNDPIGDAERDVKEWAIDRMREINQLKQMEQYRKDFLGNVSHELKTPIFNVQGYIETLLDGGLHDERINMKYLQKASKNIDRLERITSDLEMVTMIEDGRFELEPMRFDIHSLTKEVYESVQMHAEEKNIELTFKKGCDRSFYVFADKGRIKQVLINLLVNSIKYGKDGGETAVGLYDMGENVLVEIADNGIGIKEEHLVRLFERFYRVDKGRSRDSGGTGLGLSIVKHIIEAHEQTINVRSTYGMGSTFGFTLKRGE